MYICSVRVLQISQVPVMVAMSAPTTSADDVLEVNIVDS